MKALTLKDTNVLKGVAIVLLLFHHCLYTGEGYNDLVIHGHPVFQNIGEFSKLCVALFVFLSGYGLTAKTMKDGGIGNLWCFYRHRYMKLMLNYWVVYLIFVPIGVLFFHRTFPVVYGENWWFKAIVDFLGLHQAVIGHPHGYNATWWFFGVIIIMYLIYPLLWRYRRIWFLMIPIGVMTPTVASFIPFFGPSDFGHYFLAFVCGLVFAYKKIELGGANLIEKMFLLLLFLLACFFRFYAWNVFMWDAGIIAIGLVLYSMICIPQWISAVLAFLGKHSYNIFLFHTFIYYYWFHDCIYWSRNPIIIPLTLLVVCIPISMVIEWLKSKLCFSKLQAALAG